MNKLGPHFQKLNSGMLNLFTLWQPKVAVWVDPNPEGIAWIRQRSPDTFIIGRRFEAGTWNSPNLKDRAYYWADRCAEMGPCDAYVCWNEPFGHDSIDLFARFDDYQMWFRERILQHGIEAVAFNFGTGNFTKDGPNIAECFPKTAESFTYFGIHEYSWPNMQTGEGYYCNRYPTWLQDIGRVDAQLIVTECGLTQAVVPGRPDVGFRTYEDGVTDDRYLDTLDCYNGNLMTSPNVLGAAIFNFSGWGWDTFEHLYWERLSDLIEIGNNGDDDMVKIYNFNNAPPDGETTTWEWLESVFGDKLKIHPVTEIHQPKDGDYVYKIVYLDARVGDTSCIINVKDENGEPVFQETVIFWWESAEPHGYPDKGWNWTENGATGDTNVNGNIVHVTGEVGPGMGTGAYYDPKTEEGPHKVWIYDLPSEMVSGIGMIPGGDPDPNTPGEEGPHAHVNIGYQRVKWGGEPPPPPPPPPPGDFLEEAQLIAEDMVSYGQRLQEILPLIAGDTVPDSVKLKWPDGTEAEYHLD